MLRYSWGRKGRGKNRGNIHRQYPPSFKVKVALEAIRVERAWTELARNSALFVEPTQTFRDPDMKNP